MSLLGRPWAEGQAPAGGSGWVLWGAGWPMASVQAALSLQSYLQGFP